MTSLLRLSASCVIALVVACTGAEAQTFQVNIPDHLSTSRQISRVRISFELSQAPNASTRLKVNDLPARSAVLPDGVPLGVPTSDFIPLDPASLSDQVQFYTTGNNLVIDLRLLSDFAPGSCTRTKVGTSTRKLTIATNATIQRYRMTSYTTPTDDACNCPNRRTSVNPATLTDINGAPTTLANDGRHGLDIILVLDRSGSMSNAPADAAPGSNDDKMRLLKWAVAQFIETWKDSAVFVKDDRLGVVWFHTTAAVTESLVEIGSGGTGWNTIESNLDGVQTDDMTALGDGISLAVKMAKDSPLNDAVIVVMTNGKQNQGRQIVPGNSNGLTLGGPGLAFWDLSTNRYAFLRNACIQCQTIGIGSAATVQAELLDKIAAQTGGTPALRTGGQTDDAFLGKVVDLLKGSTASRLGYFNETIAQGATVNPAKTMPLGGDVKRAIVVLGWRSQRFALDLDIIPPGTGTLSAVGPLPITAQRIVDQPFYTIHSVALPAQGPAGAWSVRVKRKTGVSSAAALNYHLSLFTVEGRLSYRLEFPQGTHHTGEPIDFRVQISDQGQPLERLTGSIKVTVAKPGEGLGNILRGAQVSADDLTDDPASARDRRNAYERKLDALTRTGNLLSRIEPQPTNDIALVDTGDSAQGDQTANDGMYSMRFTDTRTPGLYRFRVTIDFDRPSLGHIVRVETLELHVRVKTDFNSSEIANQAGAAGGQHTIVLAPADQYGNYLGPGYGRLITVTGANVVAVSDPQQTGTYTVQLTGIPAGSDPPVSIVVDDRPLGTRPVSQWKSGAGMRGAIFAGIGFNNPQGTFNTVFDPGFSFHAGVEFPLKPQLSIEGVFGFDRFNPASALDLVRGTVQVKAYGPANPIRVAAIAGVGFYKFDPGDAHGGVNVGGVVEAKVNPRFSVEGTVQLHNVATPTTNTRFVTVHGGFRYRF